MARDTDIRTDGRVATLYAANRDSGGTHIRRIVRVSTLLRRYTKKDIYQKIVNQPLQEVRGYEADSAFTAHDGIVDIVVD